MGGEGVELPTKFSKRGGLTPLERGTLERLLEKRGVIFFQGGCYC